MFSTLERKITFSFATLSCVFLLMAVLTYAQVNKVTESTRYIQNVLEPSLQANLIMSSALKTTLSSVQSQLLLNQPTYINQHKAAWSIIEKRYRQLLNYSEKWNTPEHRQALSHLYHQLTEYRQLQQQLINQHTGPPLSRQQGAAVIHFQQTLIPLHNQLIASLRKIYDPQSWEMERIFIQEELDESKLRQSAILLLVLTLTSALILALLLSRAVISPLLNTIQLASRIAQGDYSPKDQPLSGEPRLDHALIQMLNNLSAKEEENQQQKYELQHYNRELKQSNEELSQFSYRTSHDLKAPLITVRRLAEMISLDIKQQHYQEASQNAGKIHGHIHKLESLLSDILHLTKAELEGDKKEHLLLSHIVDEIKQKLQLIYLDHRVTIEYAGQPNARFYASRVRLSQILENLLSNGIKYADRHKQHNFVKITTPTTEQGLAIQVEDNGVGIPPQFHSLLFGMFQRFHPQLATGSGLGMYIIKKHLHKMRSKIHFTSSENGTKFIIELVNSKGDVTHENVSGANGR